MKKIPVRSSGSLKRFGYRIANTEAKRRAALVRILFSGRKPLKLYHQLNAVSKLTRRTQPTHSLHYASNGRWVLRQKNKFKK
jgi:hypothetical protein